MQNSEATLRERILSSIRCVSNIQLFLNWQKLKFYASYWYSCKADHIFDTQVPTEMVKESEVNPKCTWILHTAHCRLLTWQ